MHSQIIMSDHDAGTTITIHTPNGKRFTIEVRDVADSIEINTTGLMEIRPRSQHQVIIDQVLF